MSEQKTYSFQQLRQLSFPEQPYLIANGLLPQNGLLFIGGGPKSYKSFLLQTIIYHLLLGSPLFEVDQSGRTPLLTTKPAKRILLLEQEIGLEDTRSRLLGLYNLLPAPQRMLFDQNLFIRSRDYELSLDKSCEKIDRIIQEIKPDLVCFDPLIEFHSLNENDAASMGLVLRNLAKMQETHHFAAIISHHQGKPDWNDRSGPDLLRGSSVIYGKGDTFLMLSNVEPEAGRMTLGFTVRRGPPLPKLQLALDWGELRARASGWKVPKQIVNRGEKGENKIQ